MAIVKYNKASITEVKQGVRRYLIHGQSLMPVVIDFTHGSWAEPDPYHSHEHEQPVMLPAAV